MPDAFISATDANRSFSRLLRSVEDGAQVTITKDGKPVAVMVPASAVPDLVAEAARTRMLEMLQKGMAFHYDGKLDRDALHSR
ncbi:type II toxin-antitoxin system prevent-host-death family antitoxin [Aerophototrophica crusticola]|uniref:Antitoxin n=1 Tax=Aerophototrophica crusticola TaxID=1709002 RepID=A0A858RAA6_9PROT|nr:type II toxin-antitoxin system prevent-host-death family antitoxin [Rhodospirillaceae bacterium B3]